LNAGRLEFIHEPRVLDTLGPEEKRLGFGRRLLRGLR
jgi:hypothetical protein